MRRRDEVRRSEASVARRVARVKPRLLPRLACPATRGPLRLVAFETSRDEDGDDVEEGALVGPKGHVYPIVRGVPRLVEGSLRLHAEFRRAHAARLAEHGLLTDVALAPPSAEFEKFIAPTMRRFEVEWRRHDLTGLTWGLDPETRVARFLDYVALPRESLAGKFVLDAGAGTGQAACACSRLGCDVVAVDLSPAIERGRLARRDLAGDGHARVHFVQGDLMRPPFRDGAFDVIHSSGVLHHTPDTRRAFDAVARLVAPGGVFGVWLYAPTPDWELPLVPFVRPPRLSIGVKRLRRVTPKMNPQLLWAAIWTYAATFHAAYKINELVRRRPHAQTIRERTTSLFDTLAPPYSRGHTPEEVSAWFRDLGFTEIADTSDAGNAAGFNVRGRRPL